MIMQLFTEEARKAAADFEWRTHQNEIVKVSDMTNAHLVNLQRYLLKRVKLGEEAQHDHKMTQVDDKVQPTFSGFEEKIEYFQTAYAMVSIEILTRIAQNRISNYFDGLGETRAEPDEIPFD